MLKTVIYERPTGKGGVKSPRCDVLVRKYRKLLKQSGIKWVETFGIAGEIVPEIVARPWRERHNDNVTVFRSVE